MAGINSIGVGGMTHQQYSNATMNTAALMSQTTGTAKQQTANVENQNNKLHDGVQLSDKATQSLTDENEMQDEQFQKDQQEAKKSDNQESKLQEFRLKQNAGHAKTFSGAQSKEEKSENKSHINMPSSPTSSSKAKPEEGGNIVRDDIQRDEDLNQAATLGITQEEAKKQLKEKRDEKDNIKATMSNKSHANNVVYNADDQVQSDENIKIDKVKAEDINRVMNRTPEEILADVPEQFKATAKIMVAGQLDTVGKPKEALTQIKTEPRAESALLELMPAEPMGEIEVVENPDCMQMAFPEPSLA